MVYVYETPCTPDCYTFKTKFLSFKKLPLTYNFYNYARNNGRRTEKNER